MSYQSKARLPKGSGMMKQIAFQKNALKSPVTMAGYRTGFRNWWKGCPRYLKSIKMKPVGGYDQENQHHGEMFSLPGDFSLTSRQAGQILYKCFKTGEFTISQMKQIKKTLAYAWSLDGGEPGKNYPHVPGIWEVVTDKDCHVQKKFILPTRIPNPEDLRKAFTKAWPGPQCGMSLVDWSRGLIAAWDWSVVGARAVEDLKRIKNGESHGHNRREGFGYTQLKGGRAKLAGKKKGTRPWKVWRVCMCQNEHRPLPDDIEYALDKDGNPQECIHDHRSWCTECPINCMELILRGQYKFEDKRIYRKWNKKGTGGYGKGNQGELIKFIFKWFKTQGVEPDWDSNAGRKSLGRWLKLLNVPYEESFEIHGDLLDIWGKHYQVGLPKRGNYKTRNQSADPEDATRALRKFAMFCGRGQPAPVRLNMTQKLLMGVMEGQGRGEEAKRIVFGIPEPKGADQHETVIDLAMDDERQQFRLMKATVQRKRKRKRTASEAEI